MILSLTENARLITRDPTGTRQKQLANAIEQLPAKRRAVAGMKSAIVAAIGRGIDSAKTTESWRLVANAEGEIAKLDRIVRAIWPELHRRGATSQPYPPETTIVEPDAPSGLSGYVVVVALGTAIAALAATVILALVGVATAPILIAGLVVAGIAATVALIQSYVDIAKEKTAQLTLLAQNPAIAPAMDTPATGKTVSLFSGEGTSTLLLFAGGAALLYFFLNKQSNSHE